MSNFFAKFFSNPSNARRAAKAAGIKFTGVEQARKGWQVVPVEPGARRPAPEVELGGAAVADALLANARPRTVAKVTVRHKEFATYAPSRVEKPVEFVRNYLGEHGAGMSRKDAMQALVAAGINYATARTQYQLWFQTHR